MKIGLLNFHIHKYYRDSSVFTKCEQLLVMGHLNLNVNVFVVMMVSCVVAVWLMESKHKLFALGPTPCSIMDLGNFWVSLINMHQLSSLYWYAVFHTESWSLRWQGRVGDTMLLGWESNTSMAEVRKAWGGGGELELRGGKSQVPHPLYETLVCYMYIVSYQGLIH